MFRTLSNGTQVNAISLLLVALFHIAIGVSALIHMFPYYRPDLASLPENRAILAVFWFVGPLALTAFGVSIICFLVGWLNV